jgi:nicotinamide-nucleotide amidase
MDLMQTPADISELAARIVQQAIASNSLIVTAESCTGGMVAAALTDIAGSSAALERGLVTYSNAAKMELLGVKDATLTAHGAVSAECAAEMVAGALAKTPAAMLAVAITGIAGPDGGTPDKPVGLVHFARQRRGETAHLDRVIFPGDRPTVRALATLHALRLLARLL